MFRIAVVLINFTNNQAQPWTIQQARDIAFDTPGSAKNFYIEASYGQQTLDGDVLGWWTIPYDNTPCDTLAWKNAARQIALSQGINLDTDYNGVALAWPRTNACDFNSRTGSFHNGDLNPYSLSHETGHYAFGLSHAAGLTCIDDTGQPAMLSTNCVSSEYGDIFDVMAASLHHFNAWEKARLGWLTNYQVVTASGRYIISPQEWSPQPSPQLLLVQRADGTVLALEFRQPYGVFDHYNATDLAVNGVLFRVATEMPWLHTQGAHTSLLDAHPSGGTYWFDAPMTPGETFTDPLGGLSVTVVSVSGGQATVDITIG